MAVPTLSLVTMHSALRLPAPPDLA